MKKRYEFKIEDIKTVSLSSLTSDNYTMNFVRKYDENGNDTRQFVTTYSAIPEVSATDKNKIIAVCRNCGSWNAYDKEEFSEDFNPICRNCYNEKEDLTNESAIINEIHSYLDEEVFFESEIYINGVKIE